MPCHHMQHGQNMGPILFARNENIAHVMPHVTTCAVTSYMHRVTCTQASHPLYENVMCQELYLDVPFAQAK